MPRSPSRHGVDPSEAIAITADHCVISSHPGSLHPACPVHAEDGESAGCSPSRNGVGQRGRACRSNR